jgi:hypothetical protein
MMYDWGAFWTILAFLAWGVGCFWCGMQAVRSRLKSWCDAHILAVETHHDAGYNDALEEVSRSVFGFKVWIATSKHGEI